MKNRSLFLAAAAFAALGLARARAEEGKPPAAAVNATFQRMRSLVGDWKGTTTDGKAVRVSYALVSDGSALMERLDGMGEEMISMYAPDGEGVMMTHYCSMHNQPRMRAAAAANGPLAFRFVDATNLSSPDAPHMDHLTVTLAEGALKQEWAFKANGQEKSETFSYTRAK